MTLLLAGVAFKGVSQISVAEYERAKKTVDVVSIQNLYNVEDRSVEDVLLKCERDGIAFLPWFPLAGFRLTKACGSEANSFGTERRRLKLRWRGCSPAPSTLRIRGTSSIPHFDENLAAAGVALTANEMGELS
jgi:aryl-alcohol dehydrogenase-like predicted oxidoreductase